MRVLLVTAHLRCGGAERVMSWLAHSLDSAGHQVTLLTWYEPTDDFFAVPVTVARLGVHGDRRTSWLGFQADRLRFARMVRRLAGDSDVVLSFITDMNIATLIATAGLSTPVIVSERNTPGRASERPRNRVLAGRLIRWRAAAFVVQTDDIAQRFHARWGVSRAVVIPNTCAVAVSEAGPEERAPVILSVGRLVEMKDHQTLIRAWGRIAEEHREWRLRIVGAGPLADLLRAVAVDCGVEGRLDLVEPHLDIAEEYRNASIFAFPSLREGFPNALLEAAASGCPCVATDCPGGSAEILRHGEAGVLTPVGDEEALANALEALIRDPQLREDLGRAGALAAGRYREPDILERWVGLLTAPHAVTHAQQSPTGGVMRGD